MLAEKFIARLERQGLLEEKVIAELREQIADSRFVITPEAVAKLLVDNGHLTTFQARKLVGELMEEAETESDREAQPAAKSSARPAKRAAPQPPEDDELGLLPFEGDGSPPPAPAKPAPAPPKPAAAAPAPSRPASKPAKPTRKPERPARAAPKNQDELEEIVELDAATAIPAADELKPLDAPSGPESPYLPDALSPFDMGAPGGMMGDLSATGPGGAGLGAPPEAPPPPPAIKKMRSRSWNTSVIIIAGVPALFLICFAIWVLYSYMTSGRAAEFLDLAEQDYKAESYGNAIKKYDKYLKDYPSDDKERISFARVKRGLARMRLAVQGAKDMRLAFETTREVLPEIEKEEKFGGSRDEVAAILPTIAAGFASQALSVGAGPKAVELVNFADEAMLLVNNASYIPTSLKQSKQATIDRILRDIGLAKRSILQDSKLHQAVAEINKVAAEGKTVEAFEIRRALVKDFPGLESNADLNATVLRVAAAERDLVKLLSDARDSATEDLPSPITVLRCVLSHREGGSVDGADNQVAFVLAKGAVYGLDATTGQVLWRRFVGHETLSHPVAINKLPGADALVVDARRNEVLRLQAKTGNVVWRLPIAERFFTPSVLDSRALVSTVTGRIFEVDLESGKSSRSVQVPLPLSAGAGASSRWPNAYQTGTHSNLYVLDAESLACREVFYLGHKLGAVTVPPVMSLNIVFVAENAGTDYSLLHVLVADDKGLSLKRNQEPYRLNGLVNVPLLQFKNRVIAMTNFGEVKVFEVAQTDTETTVKLAASQVATSKTPQPGYGLMDGSTLFTAGERVAGYDIQTTREQLNRKWAQNEQETFIAPLQKFGTALVHVRRRRGSPGVTVSAVLLEGGTEVWRTDLAVPITHLTGDVARKQISVITEHGDLFRVNAAAQKAGLLDTPAESAEVKGSAIAYAYQHPGQLADGRIVASNSRDPAETLLFDPSKDSAALTHIKLHLGERKAALPPIALENSLLVPLQEGQIVLMAPETGKAVSLPFQLPRLEPGARVKWHPAAFIGSDRREVAISDGVRKLFRIGVKEQPQRHLAPLAEADLAAEFVRPLTAAGDTVYGVQHGPSADVVQAFALPNLTVGKQLELKGRVTLGPWQVGDAAIFVSDKDGLVCLESGQNQRWAVPLTHGPLCGRPLLDGNTLWMTSTAGHVWRVAADTGAELGGVELGDPLSSAPVLYGTTLVTATSDGTLVMMKADKVTGAKAETAQVR